MWYIDEENAIPSDHELIVFKWTDCAPNIALNHNSKEYTGWDIDGLTKDEEKHKQAQEEWLKKVQNRGLISKSSSQKDLENEAVFIQETLIIVLDETAKKLRITAYSKRWWNNTVKEARLKYSQARREYKTSL